MSADHFPSLPEMYRKASALHTCRVRGGTDHAYPTTPDALTRAQSWCNGYALDAQRQQDHVAYAVAAGYAQALDVIRYAWRDGYVRACDHVRRSVHDHHVP